VFPAVDGINYATPNNKTTKTTLEKQHKQQTNSCLFVPVHGLASVSSILIRRDEKPQRATTN
jgi:hypothetical protein